MIENNIIILDYKIGNIASIKNAIEHLGYNSKLSRNHDEILNSKALILPGVGAFSKAMDNLQKYDLINTLNQFVNIGKPLLGICLGMQLLFDESEEFGKNKGLGLIEGSVVKFKQSNLPIRLPNVNWLRLEQTKSDLSIFDNINYSDEFYFIHSYYVLPNNIDEIISYSDFSGIKFCSAVNKKNIFGMQFHPEKSSKSGLNILNNFINL